MEKLPIQYIFNDVSSGVFNKVKWNMVPPNSVDSAVNFVFDDVYGEAVTRKGTTLIGAQVTAFDNAIAGLHYHANSTGTVKRLISVANTGSNNVLYYFNGTNWVASDRNSDTAGLKTRFETFLDYTVRLNGTDTIMSTTDGASWGQNSALGDSSMPSGAKYAKVYKAQLLVAGASSRPDSLYVSSVPNAGGTAISWSTGNREIVINPQDGQNITGLGEVGGMAIIFKERSMYRWNNRSTEADTIVEVGCSSNESITNCGAGLLGFFNPKGIWLSSGEQPILISRRVQKWIDGMASTFYDDVAAIGDDEHLYTSIGDCTVDGKSYSNVVLRYSINTKEWAVFSYAHEFRVFTTFIDSNVPKLVGGDTTNRVLQIESTSMTDNGTAIGFEIQTHDLDFGSRGFAKELSDRVMAFGVNPSSVLIQVKVNDGNWVTLGTMTKSIQQMLINQTVRGNFLRFRAIGVATVARFRFQGLELSGVTLLDYSD